MQLRSAHSRPPRLPRLPRLLVARTKAHGLNNSSGAAKMTRSEAFEKPFKAFFWGVVLGWHFGPFKLSCLLRLSSFMLV